MLLLNFAKYFVILYYIFNMTAELLQPIRTSNVRRCLFGRPDKEQDIDDFMETRKQMDLDDARRFKRRWNVDILRDKFVDGEYEWITKSSSDSDIPSFYSKGYPHKCRRRALTPCVGKSLAFMEEESCGGDVRASSPVQYCNGSATVDVFIGLKLSGADEVTPLRRRYSQSSSDASESEPSPSSPVRLPNSRPRMLLQRRLTGKSSVCSFQLINLLFLLHCPKC